MPESDEIEADKTAFYQVVKVLRDRRLKYQGLSFPLTFGLKDFSVVLSYMSKIKEPERKIDRLGEILRRICSGKTKDRKILYVEMVDDTPQSLEPDKFKENYEADKKITLIYGRAEIDEYITELTKGDEINQDKAKTGVWFDPVSGYFKKGKIPRPTRETSSNDEEDEDEIKRITYVEPEQDDDIPHHYIVLNKNYLQPIKFKPDKKFWKVVVELAGGAESVRCQNSEEAKRIVAYSKNPGNIIYTKSDYSPKRFLEGDQNYVASLEGVEFDTINDQEFQRVKGIMANRQRLKED